MESRCIFGPPRTQMTAIVHTIVVYSVIHSVINSSVQHLSNAAYGSDWSKTTYIEIGHSMIRYGWYSYVCIIIIIIIRNAPRMWIKCISFYGASWWWPYCVCMHAFAGVTSRFQFTASKLLYGLMIPIKLTKWGYAVYYEINACHHGTYIRAFS